MPTESAAAQAATPFRSRFLAFSLGFLIIMLAVQPAFSATIQTDLWVYQQGDTVTVTGADYGSGETVEIVTTDPNGVEVDRGAASADELGGFTYQFVLMSDVPGIYDVVATGQSSGLSAATQFDPFNVTLTDPPATTWYRTVAGAIDVGAAGKYQCQSGGSGGGACLTLNSIVVDVFAADGAAGVAGPSIASKTFGPVSSPGTGQQDWNVTIPFRTSPGGGQFAIPANGRYDVRAVFSGCSTATNPCTGTVRTQTEINNNSFGVDNLAPTSAITSATPAPPYGSGGNLTLSGTASDAHSGLASPGVTVTLRNGTPTGVVVATRTDDPNGSGNWSVSFNNPPTAPGMYCVVSVANDVAGNVQSPGASQCWTIASADSAPPVVVLTLPAVPNGQAGFFNGSQVPVTGTVSATDPSGITAITCTDSASGTTLGPLSSGSRTVSIAGNGTHNISCTATDGLGNTGAASGSTNTATVKIDSDAPVATATPSRGPDSGGWYNHPFSVSFSGVDVGPSDNVTCAADVSYSGPDTSAGSITRSCSDAAGNSASATFNFKYDGTDPGATATPDRATDRNGWYNAPVTITFAAVGVDLSDSVVCDPPETYSGPDGEDISVSGDCTDAAGNITTATLTFDFDNTDPTVTVTPDRSPDHNGWYNAAVTFDTDGTDATSDIDSCDVDQTYTTPDGTSLTVSGECTDNAGNIGAGTSAAFDFDNTDPTIAFFSRLPAANLNGWNNSTVTVTWTCADTTSGPTTPTVGTPKSAEGAAQYATNHCEDKAGNSSGTASVGDIYIDLTDPTITFDGQTPGANTYGWNNSAVTLDWTCTDGLSGPATGGDSETLPTEGANQSATGSCTDLAGNSASDTQTGIDIDLTHPTITFDGQTPPANPNGWNNFSVTLDWTCADGLSGPAAIGDSVTLSSEGANQSATGTCTDLADNSASDTQTGIDIDLTAPNVAITSPIDASSTIALTIAVGGTKSDLLSGVDSVNVNGYPATLASGTFSVGSVPLSCGSNEIKATAVDEAGNSKVHAIHVTRICFSNVQFYAPLDQTTSAMSHPVTNSGKMGRVIPTKVTFKLDDGTVITDAVAAARGWTIQIGVNNADCDNGGALDSLEAYADAGQSSAGTSLFRWTSGQWMYNLDTGRPPQVTMVVNKCYRLDVYVHDGTNKVKVSTATYAIFKPTK